MDCGRRPHPPNVCAQSDPPFRNRQFRQISFNSALAVKANEKVQLSLTGSQPCAFHRAIYESCALLLSSLNGGSTGEFLHVALPFISSLRVILTLQIWYAG